MGINHNAENINSFTPSFALWCVAIPVFDLFSTIISRIIKKQSIIGASRDHVHHFFENLGFSKIYVTLLIISFGLAMLLMGIVLEKNFQPKLPSLYNITFVLLIYKNLQQF